MTQPRTYTIIGKDDDERSLICLSTKAYNPSLAIDQAYAWLLTQRAQVSRRDLIAFESRPALTNHKPFEIPVDPAQIPSRKIRRVAVDTVHRLGRKTRTLPPKTHIIRVYKGHRATPAKIYVTRQGLCEPYQQPALDPDNESYVWAAKIRDREHRAPQWLLEHVQRHLPLFLQGKVIQP